MNLRAITVNLGGGGPTATKYKTAADEWAKHVRQEKTLDLLFVQEVHDQDWLDAWSAPDWHDAWSAPDWDVVVGSGPIYKPRSAIIANFPIESFPYPTSDYHGSYVAVAQVKSGAADGWLIASVHASPTALSADWVKRWVSCGLERPVPRTGLELWDECGLLRPEPRTGGYLWHSDLMLESMRSIPAHTPLIIAGDWNEARGWDLDHRGVWGAEFFERVEAAGFVDCAFREWKAEKPTHGTYQLDHVFASKNVADQVEVHSAPGEKISDHAPIAFEVLLNDN